MRDSCGGVRFMASRLEQVSGLVGALAWPLVAVLAIGLFYSPIQSTLETISNRSNDIENIKLGSLELKIHVNELPKSSAAVATSIVGLPEREIVVLLEIAPDGGHGYCKGSLDESFFSESSRTPLQDLKTRNLVVLEERTNQNDAHCGFELYARLTEQGVSSRAFIVQLVTAQLRSANPSQ